ncbi:hypothetical protein [Haloferax profundi]|uniref:Uncharacterized protein n=1 Tax=Haloferax profundi TaxID=1544718 RepID=A0A0W1SQ45_9EURY|nr:hypothetical protein [Haloferax profundi]KTG28452.1 hypothetical protein AUR66_11590 [Haloferax profundi]
MTEPTQPRKACQYQVELYDELADPTIRPILAVELGKAKFNQLKALDEFRSGPSIPWSVSEDTATQSAKMTKARGENSVPTYPTTEEGGTVETIDDEDDVVSSTSLNSAEGVWKRIASGERWIGAIPVGMCRQTEDVYLRGFPFLMGFEDGQPKVILNRILTRDGGNMGRIYANEWARPWVIASILDATGFNMDQTTLVTMKAKNPDGTDEDSVVGYLAGSARQTVEELMDYRAEHNLQPDQTDEPELSHQAPYVLTEVLGYDSRFSLYERIGHGDSIKDIIAVFQGERDPKSEYPPDKGLSLEYSLNR